MRLKTINLALSLVLGAASATCAYGVAVNVYDNFNDHAVSGNTGTAWFSKDPFGSTGTGVIDPFLRLQKNGTEHGMNTSSVKNYLDNKMPVDGFTRDLPLANLGTVALNGNNYYNFFLDVNQVGNDPISLIDLRIWISPQLSTAAQLDALRGTPANVWGMNSGYDIQIGSGQGSGAGDLTLLVPVPANAAALGSYVYLYSQFGQGAVVTPGTPGNNGTPAVYQGFYKSDDGFEEWRAFLGTPLPPPSVPDGGSMLVLLGGAVTVLGFLRRKISA